MVPTPSTTIPSSQTNAPIMSIPFSIVSFPSGEVELAWGFADDLLQVNISLNTDLQPPLPPVTFQGEVINNRFLTQTDIIHKLFWSPSPDPSVVFYTLFRNGEFLAQFPKQGPFHYQDHNRREHVQDTYVLTTSNAAGVQSFPLTVVLP